MKPLQFVHGLPCCAAKDVDLRFLTQDHLLQFPINLTHKEVAVAFTISVKIVETYRARIVLKLDAHSIVELVHLTYRHRLV
jgi:hypothetical protein